MTTTAKRTLTLEEFLARPETKPYSEYIDGEVVRKAMPNRKHARLQKWLLLVLEQYLVMTGLGEIYPEFRCVFRQPGRRRALVPDLSYVARERITDDLFQEGPPDLVVEVLSPEDRPGRVADKVRFYLENGVRLVWVVDGRRREIRVSSPDAETRVLRPGDLLDGGDVLRGFSLAVDELFARL